MMKKKIEVFCEQLVLDVYAKKVLFILIYFS